MKAGTLNALASLLPRSLEKSVAVLAFAGVASVLAVYGIWLDETARSTRLESRTALNDLLATTTAGALSVPLDHRDAAGMRAVLVALKHDEDFVGARVLDPAGAVLAEERRDATPRPTGPRGSVQRADAASSSLPVPVVTITRPLYSPKAEAGAPRGTLEITVSHDRIMAEVGAAKRRHTALSVSIIATVLTLLASLGLLAARPLRTMRGDVDALARGHLDRQVSRFPALDEIDAVAASIDDFRRHALEAQQRRDALTRLSLADRTRVYAAAEDTAGGIVILDERHRVIFANAAVRAMLPGWTGAGRPDLRRHFGRRAARSILQAIRTDAIHECELHEQVGGRSLAARVTPVRAEGSVTLGTAILVTDITERLASEAEIERMARTDALTGLPNRRAFDAHLQQSRASGYALLLLDLDRFKAINDTLGHAVGDALLRGAAARLRAEAGPEALIARLSGDEFGIVLRPAAGETHLACRAEDVARRVLAALARPVVIEGREVRSGTSVGLVLAAPHAEPADAVRRADLALCDAKEKGRGELAHYDAAFDERLCRNHMIEQRLEPAIENGEIALHFQPKRCLRTNRLSGYEALARWRLADGTLIHPGEFVTVAEQSGRIEALTRATFRAAAHAAVRLGCTPAMRMAVNLSPAAFPLDPDQLLMDACREAGCTADAIEVEVTETAFLSHTSSNVDAISRMRARGARVVLDDFGTGYSALSTLVTFPVDGVKIDRAFTGRLDGDAPNSEALAVVRAIVELAHALGMEVTAEGVESPFQLAQLRAAGCDEAQGYLIGHPCPLEETAALHAASPLRLPARRGLCEVLPLPALAAASA